MAKKPKTQRATFIETARKLGCDESEAAFDKKLAKIVKPKPMKQGGKPRGK